MKNLLAIIIPTLYENANLYDRLITYLDKQKEGKPVEIITILDNRQKTTGAKRNEGLDKARAMGATYVANFDDDDLPGPTYIQRGIETMNGGYDCAELWGQYYENNRKMNPFHHSIIHNNYADPKKSWWQDDKFYYRNPNHLNFIKLSLLDNIRFKDQTIGEDGHFSISLIEANVLKKEYPVKEITYFYFAGNKKDKKHDLEPIWVQQRGIKL